MKIEQENSKKVKVNTERLERKKSFLEDLLVFVIEDRSLGFLMEKTEKEENVSLFKAGKYLK